MQPSCNCTYSSCIPITYNPLRGFSSAHASHACTYMYYYRILRQLKINGFDMILELVVLTKILPSKLLLPMLLETSHCAEQAIQLQTQDKPYSFKLRTSHTASNSGQAIQLKSLDKPYSSNPWTSHMCDYCRFFGKCTF